MEFNFKFGNNFGDDYEVKLTNKRDCVEIEQIKSKKPLYIWKEEEIIRDLVNSARNSTYEHYFSKYDYHTSYNFINDKIELMEERLEKLKFIRAIIGKKVKFINPTEYSKED